MLGLFSKEQATSMADEFYVWLGKLLVFDVQT